MRASTTLAFLALLGGCATDPAADDGVDPGGGDGKADSAGGSSSFATVASNLGTVYAAATDDTYVYWVDSSLWRAPKSGGTPTLLLANTNEEGRRGLATDGQGNVYVTGLGAVRKVAF